MEEFINFHYLSAYYLYVYIYLDIQSSSNISYVIFIYLYITYIPVPGILWVLGSFYTCTNIDSRLLF